MYKAPLTVVVLILVLIVVKNGIYLHWKSSSREGINIVSYEESFAERGNTDLQCCKWDENLLGKHLQ